MSKEDLGSLADLESEFDPAYENWNPWESSQPIKKSAKQQRPLPTQAAAKAGLTKAQEDYLLTVITNQGKKSGDYTHLVGISSNTASKIRAVLKAKKLTVEEKVILENGSVIFIIPQKSAYELFSMEYKP